MRVRYSVEAVSDILSQLAGLKTAIDALPVVVATDLTPIASAITAIQADVTARTPVTVPST